MNSGTVLIYENFSIYKFFGRGESSSISQFFETDKELYLRACVTKCSHPGLERGGSHISNLPDRASHFCQLTTNL